MDEQSPDDRDFPWIQDPVERFAAQFVALTRDLAMGDALRPVTRGVARPEPIWTKHTSNLDVRTALVALKPQIVDETYATLMRAFDRDLLPVLAEVEEGRLVPTSAFGEGRLEERYREEGPGSWRERFADGKLGRTDG